jgi:hypothetical protein
MAQVRPQLPRRGARALPKRPARTGAVVDQKPPGSGRGAVVAGLRKRLAGRNLPAGGRRRS